MSHSDSSSPRRSQWFARAAALFLIVALTLAVTHAMWLGAIGAFLVRGSPAPSKLDVVFLLQGDGSGLRADVAIGTYKRGLAKRIVFGSVEKFGYIAMGLGPSESEMTSKYLLHEGVPANDFEQLPCIVTSTRDEARCFADYIARLPDMPRRVGVATSWFHTSRAGWLFDRVFDDMDIEIVMIPAEDALSNPSNWWRDEGAFLGVFVEYLKWLYWLFKTV